MGSFLIMKSSERSFEEKISKLSPKTKENILSVKKSFNQFCIEKYDGRKDEEIFKELQSLDLERDKAIREVLQLYIDWLYQKDTLTTTVRSYISKVKRIFSHYGLKFDTKGFEDPLELKPIIREELHRLTIEEIQKIFKFASHRKMSFYLALASTGARPGELLQIRKRDVDTSMERVKLRIQAENVKVRAGRSVWLTKEAGAWLMPRLKELDEDDLVWAKNENPSFALKNESTQFSKLVDKAGFGEKYQSNNFRQITLYSFRSFFFGQAADIHREGYAHKILGHGGYLPQYDRMSDKQKLDWFLKVEPELTIDETRRLRLKMSEVEDENNQLKKLQLQLDNMSHMMMKQSARLMRLEADKDVESDEEFPTPRQGKDIFSN